MKRITKIGSYFLSDPNTKKINYEFDIDTIESVEALANQIIINTSKIGSIDILKVTIDVYDLENKKLLYSNSYSGILLLISRGKYVINFLESFHWYGIIYQVFQTTPQESKHHIEKIMVKTIGEKKNILSQKGAPLFLSIKSERSKLEETHLVVFSIKWNESTNDRKGLDYAKANITLECNGSLRNKEITLNKSELGKNIEIKIENDFGIHEENNGSHKLIAVVKPKYCNKLCWNGKLYSKVLEHTFERDIVNECEKFNPIYTQTEVRDIISYNISDGNLLIFTTQPNDIPTTDENNDIIKVKAIQLAHLITNNDNLTDIITNDKKNQNETNSIDDDDDDEDEDDKNETNTTIEKEFVITGKDRYNISQFKINNLKENSYYAVSYNYKKLNPIPYHDELNFVVQMPGKNLTKPTFSPVLVNISTTNSNKKGNDSTKNLEENESIKPMISFYISKEFMDYRILIEIQSIINESNILLPITTTTNESIFWLTQQNKIHSFILPDNLMKYLCNKCKLNIKLCNNYEVNENNKKFKRSIKNSDYEIFNTSRNFKTNETFNNILLTTKSSLMDVYDNIKNESLKNDLNMPTTLSLLTTLSDKYDKINKDNDENNSVNDDENEDDENENNKKVLSEEKNSDRLKIKKDMLSIPLNEMNEKCLQLQLCYKLHIFLDSKMYDMGKNCHNLTELFLINGKDNLYSINLINFLIFFFLYYML
uniref:Dolichyl-diphosphooligosaccharide--protein glycosyltransferase subunit 1 n=1 Tax=Strongyloides stercoralis TaxID=6248 RepID=A0AAF5DNT3_STRER